MEKKCILDAGQYQLEGLIAETDSDRAVIVTHPHPLYGGDMHNPVVATIADTYRRHHFTTLRFNFRGVGNSQGRYEDGVGEQKDVLAAVSYLSACHFSSIDLAGYSFGAWVNAMALDNNPPIREMVMVSPPVALMNFGAIGFLQPLKLVITGSRDEIAPADQIHRLMPVWNAAARLEIISDADHFFGGYLDVLADRLHLRSIRRP